MKSLAAKLGPKEIQANAIAPGLTETLTFAGNVEGDKRKEIGVEGIAMGKLGRAEVVDVDVVVFLFGEGSLFVNEGVWEVHGSLSKLFDLGLVGGIGVFGK